jgi:hypothetical protein
MGEFLFFYFYFSLYLQLRLVFFLGQTTKERLKNLQTIRQLKTKLCEYLSHFIFFQYTKYRYFFNIALPNLWQKRSKSLIGLYDVFLSYFFFSFRKEAMVIETSNADMGYQYGSDLE